MALFIFCIFVFSPFFIFSIFYFFLLATGSFFCFFPLAYFCFSFFFSPLVYVFFSLSKVTRMIGVPLVAKQGSFVYIFWLCSSFSFPSVHTQLFTIELFTIDLIK